MDGLRQHGEVVRGEIVEPVWALSAGVYASCTLPGWTGTHCDYSSGGDGEPTEAGGDSGDLEGGEGITLPNDFLYPQTEELLVVGIYIDLSGHQVSSFRWEVAYRRSPCRVGFDSGE